MFHWRDVFSIVFENHIGRFTIRWHCALPSRRHATFVNYILYIYTYTTLVSDEKLLHTRLPWRTTRHSAHRASQVHCIIKHRIFARCRFHSCLIIVRKHCGNADTRSIKGIKHETYMTMLQWAVVLVIFVLNHSIPLNIAFNKLFSTTAFIVA